MERQLKERLIGAAVLMAAAIILVPEMLSGPRRPTPPTAPANAVAAPLKSYTIDLNPAVSLPAPRAEAVSGESQSLQEPTLASEAVPEAELENPAHSAAQDEPAPTAESSVSQIETQAVTPSLAPAGAAPSVPAPQSPPAALTPPQQVADSPAAPATPQSPASSAAVPTSKGWAVQLGSFSSRATAQRMVQDLRASKYEAFVMPVKSGTATLYRVRIGPLESRMAAEDTLRKVRGVTSAAAIVAHP